MSLQEKYDRLIAYAQESEVADLSIVEKEDVLYISGHTSALIKDEIWRLYDEIDPDMRAGDLVLDIEVLPGLEETYEVKPGDSLSKIAKKYPGMTWQKIYEVNQDVIKDPNLIYPGQELRIPL
ncbi:MAG: LysM peptidoglycan-binding domain-containing protein [Tannerella sp.]|jgi:nucleoid-associated protein YgaU|nr:LysM peptidoglycan-binding domain-containing protein [Tannerella sp.]